MSGKNERDAAPSEEASSQAESFEAVKSESSEPCGDLQQFCPGIRIQAKDFDGKWYHAKVADVDWGENEVLVHFENWNTKFDEWIPMDSSRLRNIQNPVSQNETSVKFSKGESVMAMWSPHQNYPATIQAVLPNDRYDVIFYDGFKKRLKSQKIFKLQEGVVQNEVKNFTDIGTKEERRERKRKHNVAELFYINKRPRKKALDHATSKSQEMKTYPVNKSKMRKNLPEVQEGEATKTPSVDMPLQPQAKTKASPLTPTTPTPSSSSIADVVPSSLLVKYLDGRTETWSKQLYQRSEGRTAGKLETVILNPQGRKFRSRNEIMKYCEENGIVYSPEAFDFSAKGRPKSKSIVQTVPHKPESPLEDLEKSASKKPRRKSHFEDVPQLIATVQSEAAIPTVPVMPLDNSLLPEENKVFIGDVEVVIENGKFICPVKVCGKHFRRENLLHMHMKHYHPEFSKFLDYTPSVTDLAYARTVGSLESIENSQPPPRKSLTFEKLEKTAVKSENFRRTSLPFIPEPVRDVKKPVAKPIETKAHASEAAQPVKPASPINVESDFNEEPKNRSISDSFQIFKNAPQPDTPSVSPVESRESPLEEIKTRISSENNMEDDEILSSAHTSSRPIKQHYRHHKQRRPRSFIDHIRKKKYFGQDHPRSNYRFGKQQSSVTSHLLAEDQSNSNTSSQAFSLSRYSKQQMNVSNEISGKKNLLTNFRTLSSLKKRKQEKHRKTMSSSNNLRGSNELDEPLESDENNEVFSKSNSRRLSLSKNLKSRNILREENTKDSTEVSDHVCSNENTDFSVSSDFSLSRMSLKGFKKNGKRRSKHSHKQPKFKLLKSLLKFEDTIIAPKDLEPALLDECLTQEANQSIPGTAVVSERENETILTGRSVGLVLMEEKSEFGDDRTPIDVTTHKFLTSVKSEPEVASKSIENRMKPCYVRLEKDLPKSRSMSNDREDWQTKSAEKAKKVRKMSEDENMDKQEDFTCAVSNFASSRRKWQQKKKEAEYFKDNPFARKKVRFEDKLTNDWSLPNELLEEPKKGKHNYNKKKGYVNYIRKKPLSQKSVRFEEDKGDEKSVQNSEVGCSVDHTEGTEDSKSPLTVDNEKVEKLRRNEIINCVCGVAEEDGLMIQCDLCLCWQHGHCTDILRDSDVPEKYVCSVCLNPYRGRQSSKYSHDQDWLKEGILPSLSFRSKREDVIDQRRSLLKRSHDLGGSIALLAQVIHSLRVKVNIAEKKDHPKLWLWAKKWNEKRANRLKEESEMKDDKLAEAGSEGNDVKTEGSLGGEEKLAPKAPEPEAPIDSAECRINLLDHLIHYQTLVDARLSCIESQVAELESMQEDAVDDETPDQYPRTKATVQMLLRDLGTMRKIAAI